MVYGVVYLNQSINQSCIILKSIRGLSLLDYFCLFCFFFLFRQPTCHFFPHFLLLLRKVPKAQFRGGLLWSGKNPHLRLILLRCDIASQQLQSSLLSSTYILFFSLFLSLFFITVEPRSKGPAIFICHRRTSIIANKGNERN